MTEKQIIEKLISEGASFVGTCALGEKTSPFFPELKYAVSIGYKLSDTVLSTITDKPTITYFHHYRTVNAKLDQLALSLVTSLEAEGYAALPIAASQSLNTSPYEAVFSHKTAAALSGLGGIGKNGLFLHAEHGSKVRLATVLTDLPLSPQLPIVTNVCGSCAACVKACPAGAIYGEEFFEGCSRNDLFSAEKCSRYMKDKFQLIGRGSVCGVCIRVCPKNRLPK